VAQFLEGSDHHLADGADGQLSHPAKNILANLT